MREVHRRLFVGGVFEVGEEGDAENEEEREKRKEGVYHRRDETGVENFEEDERRQGKQGVDEDGFVAKEGRGRSGREKGHMKFVFQAFLLSTTKESA